MSTRRIRDYVNSTYNVRDLYKEVSGRDAGQGKCFCVFHRNTDTPAAKIYDNVLKCFGACNRVFTPYDFLKAFFPDELEKVSKTLLPISFFESKKSSFVQVSRDEFNGLSNAEVISLILNKNNIQCQG